MDTWTVSSWGLYFSERTSVNVLFYVSFGMLGHRAHTYASFRRQLTATISKCLYFHQLLYICVNTWYCQAFKFQSFLWVYCGLMVLLCIFLMTSKVEQFCMSMGHSDSSFVKCLFKPFVYFSIALIDFFVRICRILNVFWIEFFIAYMCCKYLLSFAGLPLYFLL